jgi:hypothetical protein
MGRSEELNLGLPILVSTLQIISSGLYNITGGSKGKMRPRRMKAAIEAMRSKEVGSYKASRVYIICLPHHSSHIMQPLGKAFMGPLKTFCGQETEH